MTTTRARALDAAAGHPEAGHSEAGQGADRVWADTVDADAFAGLRAAWRSLAERAAVPNAFMDPAVAVAIARSSAQRVHVLLAWRAGAAARSPQLIGAWMLMAQRPHATWPFRALVSPADALAYLGTPVVDAAFARPALAAMLEKIRRSPDLPRLIQANDLNDGAFMADLGAVLAEGRMASALVERRTRARLQSGLDPREYWARSMSAERLQGLARKRRQLAKAGRLEFVEDGEPERLAAALDEFFVLEASGWKGARGSALASHPATEAITRAMVAGLSAHGLVRMHALRLDGRALAMWIILRSGRTAFTWRTGYDEAYARFSPGVLLLEDTTAALLSDPAVAETDSCNHRDTGFQAERWAERHDVVDLLIDVRPGPGLLVRWLGARERAYRAARERARRLVRLLRQGKRQAARWAKRRA